ncbi:diguanylate cyclase [Mangrovicella endophytica]|uniref:diguanylate cyclase n=1 Tax=Mangrovicella endophytica TaxID=2066697 RepID=UPI000C9E09F9|nr:diguanylate cyclase [Mangrovicella endophytica]
MTGKIRRSTLTAAAIGLLIAGFCAAAVSALLELRQDRFEQAQLGARNLLATLSADIAGHINSYDMSLRAVIAHYQDPAIAALSPALQQSIMFDGELGDGTLGSILILDENGNVVKDAGSLPPRQDNFRDRSYFQIHRDRADVGLYISEPFFRRLTGEDQVIALSRRISRSDGSFAGVVVATMRLIYFRHLFERANIDPEDAINVFLDRGVLVMRSPYSADQIGRDLSKTPNVARFMTSPAGSFSGKSAIDSVLRYYSFQHVEGLPLILDVAIAEDRIYEAWRNRAAVLGGFLAVLCLLSAGLWLVMRREADRRSAAEVVTRQSEAKYRLLADHATDVIMQLNSDLVRQYISPACRPILGYDPAELIGKSTREIIHPEDWPAVSRIVEIARRDTSTAAEATYRLRHKSGDFVWIEGRYSFVADDNTFVVVLRDVSKRKAAELKLAAAHAALAKLAHTDALTGLANRRRFDETIATEIRRASRDGTPVSLIMLDVDRFKAYNDRYGHPAGDECLRRVGAAIGASVLRPADLAARYGGEEFAVLLPGTDEAGARHVAEKIRLAIHALEIEHEGNEACGGIATISAGCATSTCADDDLEKCEKDIISAADKFLYEAKRFGRNRIISFSDLAAREQKAPLRSDELERLAMLESLKRAGTLGPDEDLDRLARLAAELLDTPQAFISLVEQDEVVLIGRHGLEVDRIPRHVSFCTHAIVGEDPLMVADTMTDPRFADNPFAISSGGIRFYLGAPVVDPATDMPLGAFCVADDAPRQPLHADKVELLSELAILVSHHIDRKTRSRVAASALGTPSSDGHGAQTAQPAAGPRARLA